jgi:hypothetical protein
MDNIYQIAWFYLLRQIEAKPTWGKQELKNLMLNVLVSAGYEKEK